MNNELKLGVGLAHQVEITARKADWDTEDFVRLSQNEALMRDVRAVLRGDAEIKMVSHRIDCSVQPMIPVGWKVRPEDQIASRFQGELLWSPDKVRLHLDPGQSGDGRIEGEELKAKLAGVPVLPANVLDYLLAHKTLIPPEWKGKAVFFWGTAYRYSDSRACVRCLRWDSQGWYWYGYWLDDDWCGSDPSAILAG